MTLLSSMACRLGRTKFGRRAMTQPDRIGILKQKPTARVYGGLVLIALSYITCLPALAFLSFLTVKMSRPLIIAAGGPVVLVLVHIIFGVGVYLAGRNYAMEALLWTTKRFLKKYA